ncbi:MAG: efflux transporter outer membrane subunit [Planctomycetes bacterium]|nr:efflux transporter outer membrane subunit [Planctomycetota bacterium]
MTAPGRSRARWSPLAAVLAAAFAGCAATEPALPHRPPEPVDLPNGFGTPTAAGHVAVDWWLAFAAPGLDAAVRQGLEHNRDLRAAVARLDAARAQAVVAGGAAWPTLEAGADAARRRQNFPGLPLPGGNDLHTTYSTFGVDLTASWEIDLWGRVRAGVDAASAEFAASAVDLRAAQLSLAAQIARAWFARLEARLQLELAERSQASWAASAEAVQGRFAAGVRPALDVHLVATGRHAAQAQVAFRREQHERAVRQLELLLGRYPSGAIGQEPAALPVVGAPPPAGLPATLLRQRPDLVAAEFRALAQDRRVAAATAALYPRLVLSASVGTNAATADRVLDPDFLVWSLLGGVTAPLFRGGALRAEVDLQQAQLQAACATWGAAVLRACGEVEIALAAGARLAERAAGLELAHTAAQAAFAAASTRYRAGLENVVTLLEAQRRADETESQWLAARHACVDARITLFVALGGGFDLDAKTPEPTGEPR